MKHWFVLGFLGFVLAGVAGCGGDDDKGKGGCDANACAKCITDAIASNDNNADCSSPCKGCVSEGAGGGGNAAGGATGAGGS